MTDDEALLALAAGDGAELETARAWLYDTYFEPLLAILEEEFRFDGQFALTGAGLAFDELFREAMTVADQLQGRERGVWKWLLRRAIDRSKNERASHFRKLTGPYGGDQVNPEELDIESGADGPQEAAILEDDHRHLIAVLTEVVPTLDKTDRHIFLHDLVTPHELLTPEEAEYIDDEYISRSAPDGIYMKETLKKRRQRLREKLEATPALKGLR